MFHKEMLETSLSHKILIHGTQELEIEHLFFLYNISYQNCVHFEFDCQKFKMTIKTFKKLLSS